MEIVKIKKQPTLTHEELLNLSKEELVAKIKTLEAHNMQLKNIILKQEPERKAIAKDNKFDFSNCRFRRILLRFFYLGWNYHGYVKQEDTTKTIENYLFDALIRTCLIKDRESSNYHRCGRTDKGVSSFGQVISIDIRSRLHVDNEQLENEIEYCKLLNRVLPDNVQCIAWCPIEENYSARFDCKSRTYKYFFPKDNLDLGKMSEGASLMIGTHDFRNLCKMDVGNGVTNFIRKIIDVEISTIPSVDEDEYTLCILTIRGQSFLWHQIRCIVAILFLIGQHKELPNVVKELLDVENNPQKPEYNIASEIPLNLYECEYEMDKWNVDQEALLIVIKQLKALWMFSSIKSTMMKCMLNDLLYLSKKKTATDGHMVDKLIQGAKSKQYIPLMKRKKCESLENRIKHYVKRSKLELNTNKTNS